MSKRTASFRRKFCLYLGFLCSFKHLALSIPKDKTLNILKLLHKVLRSSSISIREFAKLIGDLVSVCLVSKHGLLYTEELEDINSYVSKLIVTPLILLSPYREV